MRLDELTERAKREKLFALLLEKQRRQADASLYYFAKYICGFQDLELEPHWAICRWIQKYFWYDKLLLLPRGTFKSSIASVALPLWLFTKDRNLRIVLTSGELTNTKNWLSLIRQIVERNPVFRLLYGPWDENSREDTWTQTALSFSGRTRYTAEDSLTATSAKVTKVSQHYDIAICDDLVNEKNVRQKEMIDQTQAYLDLLLPILDPPRKIAGLPDPPTDVPGSRFLIGTRWHFDDLYGRIQALDRIALRAGEKATWKTMVRSCCRRARFIPSRQRRGQSKFHLEGPFFFPRRFSEYYLEKLQRSMQAYEFSCQYLNDPMPEGTSVFNPAHFGFYWMERVGDSWIGQKRVGSDISDLPPALVFFGSLDPSIGQSDESDYCAFVINAIDSAYNLYVAEVVEEHLIGNQAIIEEMFRLRAAWGVARFGVESTQFQQSILHGFRQACRERGDWLHVMELGDNRRSKDLRIRGFEPQVSARKFYLRVKARTDLRLSWQDLYYALEPGQEVLADQMIRYPLVDKDDVLDAQAYMPQVVTPAVDPAPAPPNPYSYQVMSEYWKRNRRGSRLLAPR